VLLQFGHHDAGGLHEEAGQQHQPEAHDDQVILEPLVPADAVEVLEVPPVQRHADADEADEAEQVAVEGEEEVVRAVQEFERRGPLDGDLCGDKVSTTIEEKMHQCMIPA
jgi:hypothetical protein